MTEHKKLDYIKDSVEFYPHQIEGVRHLARMKSFLLADEMGLGKSLQSLAVTAIDFQMGYASRVLVVAPVSLKGNWEQEIEDHTKFTAMVLDGTPKQREKQIDEFEAGDTQILIINYEQVVSHLDRLNSLGFDIVIYDEAHYIKNPKARRTKFCHKLEAKRHFLLTGSPMLGHVNDLWSLLYRINQDIENYWRFRNRYCNTPDAPVWMADGTFKPIGKVQVGDKIIGWERGENDRRQRTVATVEGVHRRTADEVVQVTLASGRTVKCTPDHVWMTASHNSHVEYAPLEYSGLGRPHHHKGKWGSRLQINALSSFVHPTRPLSPELQREFDWLMGIYDGEGSRDYIAQSKSHNPAIYEHIGRVLDALGVPYRADENGYQLKGGFQTYVDFLNWAGPLEKGDYFLSRILDSKSTDNRAQVHRTRDEIVRVDSLGPGEVVSMQTSTGNYIVWGYGSKNCVFGGFKDKQIVGVKNRNELHDRLHQFMLRRLKSEVLDLPEKQHVPVYVTLGPLQRRLYDEIMDELRLEAPTPGEATPMEMENALAKMTRLKQICGTPAALEFEELDEDGQPTGVVHRYPDESQKLDRVVEMCEEIVTENNEHLVCFTQSRGVLAAMQQRLTKAGIRWHTLHGDVKKSERHGVVKAWEADEPAVMLAMFQVAGVGLNMTRANKCIMIDKLYVPKLMEQAEDRLHRIGADTTQPVQIYEMITRGTIEKRVEDILKIKTELFNDVVETPSIKKAMFEALMEEALE